MSSIVRHSLSNKDVETLTGECSVCGLVAIRRAGNGYQCAVKKARAHRSWAKRNPGKASANRRQRSGHELFNQDYRNLTAGCAACGREVDMVMYGAGYACGVRARELRTAQQTSLVGQRCRECTIIDGPASAPRLGADGECPRCSEPHDPHFVAPERRRRDGGLAAEYAGAGFTTVHADDSDSYAMLEYESAVPGWRTIGSRRPWGEA